jgi:hypothetical protein
MREFALTEMRLASGPWKGSLLSLARTPHVGPLLDLMDSPRWNRIFATGPVQGGKTLLFFVLPVLYHACELEEDVIIAAPTKDLARAVWRAKILPVLRKTRYRHLLPRSGRGVRGGDVDEIELTV